MILKCIVIVERNRALGTDMFTAALSFVTVRENVLVPTELHQEREKMKKLVTTNHQSRI